MRRFQRYQRNMQAFTKEQIDDVHTKSVCVVGCGGLGGHVISSLARFGVKKLTLIDSDIFDVSNLNRQIFCLESSVGKPKVEITKEQLKDINSEIEVFTHYLRLTAENAQSLLDGHDLIMDCLDSISARLVLEAACNVLEIPMIHGAIAGFLGQVMTILPGENSLSKIYSEHEDSKGIEEEMGNPPFIPQLVASIQSSEALKLLAGREDVLQQQLLYMDLEHYSFDIIKIP